MDSENSINTTVDLNSTFWKSAEANRTSPQSLSTSLGTVSYAKAVVFWAIFVVGASGNLLVIAVGVKGHGSGNKGQTLVTRMFICCLAVSDLGLMLTGVWTSAMSAIRPSWSYGGFFCKLRTSWSTMASKMSVIMLSVIGVDRSDNYSPCRIFDKKLIINHEHRTSQLFGLFVIVNSKFLLRSGSATPERARAFAQAEITLPWLPPWQSKGVIIKLYIKIFNCPC